jgi:hypothetical protein
MNKVLTTALTGFILILLLSTNAIPCGMMKRGKTSGGMMCQNPITHADEANQVTDREISHIKTNETASHANPSKLIEERCSLCHSPMTVFLSRKPDWSHTIHRMEGHALTMNVTLLTDGERAAIIHYLNTYQNAAY